MGRFSGITRALFVIVSLSVLSPLSAQRTNLQKPAQERPLDVSASAAPVDKIQEDIRRLRKDILDRLKGQNNIPVEELEKRLKDSEAGVRVSGGDLGSAKQTGLKIEIESLGTLLKNARTHIASQSGSAPVQLAPLLNALEGKPKQEQTDTVTLLLGGLSGASQHPLQAAWVFERMRLKVKGNEQAIEALNTLEKGMAEKTQEYANPDNPAVFGAKPSDIQLTMASLDLGDRFAVAEPPVGAYMTVVKTAVSPFRDLLPDARERFFSTQRAEKRGELETQARDAVLASGGDPASYSDMTSLARQLSVLEEGAFTQLGFSAPARGAEEYHERLKAVIGRFPALGLYLVNLARYRLFLQDGIQEEAIPVGAVLETWEMGESLPAGAKVSFHAENYEGETYRGLLYTFADGSTRFQGKGVGARRGLLAVSDAREGRSVKTRIDFGADREPVMTDTSVFDARTGKRVRRELVDMAKRLTTITTFDEAGVEVREEKMAEATGGRTVTDWNKGLVITSHKDQSASIVPIAGKSGTAPFKAQYGTFDKDGRFSVNKVVLSDDKILLLLSPHVTKILGPDQKLLGFEIQLADFLALPAGEERAKRARSLAVEILKAMGTADKDGAYSIPLGNFLFDYAKPHAGGRSVRLYIDERQNFNLVVEKQDATKEIYNGRFAPGTAYKGKTSRGSFVLMGKIIVDAKGQGSQDPRRWIEYAAEGTRLQWKERFSETKGEWYKPWKADEKITHVMLIQEEWTGTLAGGHWTEKGEEEHKRVATEVAGSSTFGKIGGGIMSVPVLSHILDAGGKVGKSLYTGLMAAPQVLAAEVNLFGIGDDYLLEATASYYKNPAMRALMDEAEFLRKLTPGARAMLDARAISNRREALERQGIDAHRAPEAYRQAMEMKVTQEEALASLHNFGAGSYGARLIADGGAVTGNSFGAKAESFALTAGGVLMGAFENVAETTFNPVVWATFGLGRAVTALQGAETLLGSARFLNVALVSAKVTHTVLAGSLMTAWGAGALDNLGKTFQYYGEDRQKFYETLGHLGADVFFGALMYKEWRDSAREAKSRAALKEQARLDSLFKEAADAVAKSSAEKAATLAEAKPEARPLVQERAVEAKSPAATEAKAPAAAEAKAPAAAETNSASPRRTATLEKAESALTTARQEGARVNAEAQARAAEAKTPLTETPKAKPMESTKPQAKPVEVKAPEAVKTGEAKPVEAAAVEPKVLETAKAEAAAPAAQGRGWFESIREALGLRETGKVEAKKPALESKSVEAKAPEAGKPAEVKVETKPVEASAPAKGGKGFLDGFLDLFRKTEKPVERPTRATELADTGKTVEVSAPAKGGKGFWEGFLDRFRGTEKPVESKTRAVDVAEAPKAKPWWERVADRVVDTAKKPISTYPKLPDNDMLDAPVVEPPRKDPAPPVEEEAPMPKDPEPRNDPTEIAKTPVEDADEKIPQPTTDDYAAKPKDSPAGWKAGDELNPKPTPVNASPSDFSGTTASQGESSASSPSAGGGGGENKAAGIKAPSGASFGGGGAAGGAGGGGGGGGGAGGGGGPKSDMAALAPAKGNPFGAAPVMNSPAAPANASFGGNFTPIKPAGTPKTEKPLPRAANNLTTPPETKPSIASRFDGSKDVKTPLVAKNDAAPFASPSGVWSTMNFNPRTPPPATAPVSEEAPPIQPPLMRTSESAVKEVPQPESEDYHYTYMAPARQKYEMDDSKAPRVPAWYLPWLSLGLKLSAIMAMSSLLYKSELPYLVGFSRRKRGEQA